MIVERAITTPFCTSFHTTLPAEKNTSLGSRTWQRLRWVFEVPCVGLLVDFALNILGAFDFFGIQKSREDMGVIEHFSEEKRSFSLAVYFFNAPIMASGSEEGKADNPRALYTQRRDLLG